jgi:4-hydroxythreonine-4-phosphate dehydrogenase
MTLPAVGITLGDPGGIGPEIVLKALATQDQTSQVHYIIFGTQPILEQEMQILGLPLDIQPFRKTTEGPRPLISLYEVNSPIRPTAKGSASQENGKLSFRFLEEAVEQARKGDIQALVTAPISKYSWSLAGIPWTGHTDYLNSLFPQAIMTFWSDELKVALFTHHIPLRKATERIRRTALSDFILQLHSILEKTQRQKYRYLVAGLNPHAGERGLMGSEESTEIVPAIEEAQKKGIPVKGPFPPDIVFHKALGQEDTIVIALYHDQGLIPFKLMAFDKGINITLGLPFIRTSPDHGTAFDIAGKGKANPKSMSEAIRLVCSLATA